MCCRKVFTRYLYRLSIRFKQQIQSYDANVFPFCVCLCYVIKANLNATSGHTISLLLDWQSVLMSGFEKIQQNDLPLKPKVDMMEVFLECLKCGFSLLYHLSNIL
jgi:hypothetical protein